MRSAGKYSTAAGRSLLQTPTEKSQKNIKAMHQGTQDGDWDTLWQRFALGLKPLESHRQQTQSYSKAPDWHAVLAKLLGIQCMAAQLTPEVKKKKMTQPGFGTIVLISANLNTVFSTKAKGQL